MTEKSQRICILGGGFGGLYTALRLSQLPWEKSQEPEIILIDKSDRFLFSPLLYELITDELQTWEIAPPFSDLLAGTNVRFQQDCVTDIDIEAQRIHLADSSDITYDKLVLALGGKTPVEIVPGAKEYAIPFRNLEHAYQLRERLKVLRDSTADKIRIAIVGGGYSGVELGCKLVDQLGSRCRLRIIDRGGDVLRHSTDFNREAAKKALQERDIWLDLETAVTEIGPETISLEYKGKVDTIPVDIVLWTVGTAVNELVNKLPLKQGKKGYLSVQPTLQVEEREEVFALGDLADCQDINGKQVPATAQSAFQQADYCAWNIWALIRERPLLPFRYQNLGEMMALGEDSATLTGLGIKLDGPLAYLARRLIYLYRLPTLKHQLSVSLNWLSQPLLKLFSE